ncbi:MAG: (Fe-S)-binding protein [Candidatus Omnitrophica bacterium]|nr:(Fe-S)-binding protein [Candidatus Omnitrophota bacterium]MDD5592689.1 (Fe-S)-binding protein [Candidatus Omnitrophota bacterium]
MEIDRDKNYEIIVLPNQDVGLKAQQILVTRQVGFKHISTLAVVVPEGRRQEVCRLLIDEGVIISGYYKFLYRDYEEDFFRKAQGYKPSAVEEEFLKSITLCYVAPCIADETKIRLIAYFYYDISEILPYLNAIIKGASYNKNLPVLTYTKGRRMINLYNIKVAIAKADDIIDTWNILNEIKELVNKTFRDKDKIKPNYEEKVKVTALQIYGWLPKTNCKACGEATCLAFAVRLLQGEQKLDNCIPLSHEQEFSENRKIMNEIAGALGI